MECLLSTMLHPVTDKVDNTDYRWHVVRTLPHQERMLYGLLMSRRSGGKLEGGNILEAYCPTHTTVRGVFGGRDVQVPLFSGYVFVLSTHRALVDFLVRHYPPGHALYVKEGGRSRVLTIPEPQMRLFKEFNENYFDHVLLLERPYEDYAFNPKTNEPNDVVKVIDGPLAGCTGYLVRFRGDRRLVFRVCGVAGGSDLTVSIPNVWDFHVVRLHNAEGDRQTIATRKARAADLLIGMLEGLGYGGDSLLIFHDIMERLVRKTSLLELRKALAKRHPALSEALGKLSREDAGLLLELVRYEQDNPGYVKSTFHDHVIRPFLTPTSGVLMGSDEETARVGHACFTEMIHRVSVTEAAFYPSKGREEQLTSVYYAHVGRMDNGAGGVYFANWSGFLGPYLMTTGVAKRKLLDSFRDHAPTLFQVLTGRSSVKMIHGMAIGDQSLDVFCVEDTPFGSGMETLVQACVSICEELNATTHLALWRRYLCDVWLHI